MPVPANTSAKSKFLSGILAILMMAIFPSHTLAASSGNAFVDDKTDASNILNGMGVLNAGGDLAQGAGKIIAVFDHLRRCREGLLWRV